MDRYNPHKQMLFEVLNNFEEYYKGVPMAKEFNNADLNLLYPLKSN